MMPSNFVLCQLSLFVLFMATFTIANNIPQTSAMISEISQPYDEQNPIAAYPNHLDSSASLKHTAYATANDDDDESSSDDEEHDYSSVHHIKSYWPDLINKRYANKVIRGGSSTGSGGDSRLWAIPYRFGKRSAMPYRFGKRAGMHFRIGKKSV